jgi:predicted Fe-Mo cluster-binding NifX family protein
MRVAIPTNAPGGLEAGRSGHFGHCDVFTVIDVSPDNAVADVTTIENIAHEAGGCMAPVNLLKEAGVEAIVVGGLGKRPMQGFSEAGISVYYADQEIVPDVKSVFENLVAKKLVVMHPEQVCKGSGNCRH